MKTEKQKKKQRSSYFQQKPYSELYHDYRKVRFFGV